MDAASIRDLADQYALPDDAAWAALRLVLKRVSATVSGAVRDGSLNHFHAVDPDGGGAALARVFGAEGSLSHCFNVEPDYWLSLLEPQVTKGLAWFAGAGAHPSVRDARVAALINACSAEDRQVDPADILFADVLAEPRLTSSERPDVLAYARLRGDGSRMIVIEGKLDHKLTPKQLARYERGAVELAEEHTPELVARDIQLIVVGRKLRGKDDAYLSKHPRWQFVSWRDLILRMEKVLGGIDDKHFRRFRRTMWSNCA